jgi:uncharacterized membrane protein YozB (DUF420 family)
VDLSFLPAVNAGLNAVAASLLLLGRRLARAGQIAPHRRVMLAAFGVSSLFLALYVVHKLSRGFVSTTFHVAGPARVAYLALLASHVVLASLVPFLALALIAVAWPIWLYVSVTGVVIYVLLYHLNPAPG